VNIASTSARTDGRRSDQLRPVTIESNYLAYAEGSALVTIGNTRVLTAEYAMLPRATSERTQRESTKGRIGGRTHEIQRIIGRALRAIVDLGKLGERTIMIDCDVIQADGGTRTTSITGAYVALALALRRSFDPANAKKWPLHGALAATSVGIVEGLPLLDLAYGEDSRAEVDLNVAMTDAGAFVELQGTAEGKPFTRAQLDELLALAQSGIEKLFAAQQAALDAVPMSARGA